MQFDRSILIITGHSGAPLQPLVDRIVGQDADYASVTPVGSDKALGYRAEDIANTVVDGNVAVLASYTPESTSVLQDWARREGMNVHTVFVKAPQELSFSRAMGNWMQAKEGRPVDTLLPEIESISEQELLKSYETGSVVAIDKPHYQVEMEPKQMLRRLSSIMHSEPMWEDSVSYESTMDFEPAFGESVSELAANTVDKHAELGQNQGYAMAEPATGASHASPGRTRQPDNSPKPRM